MLLENEVLAKPIEGFISTVEEVIKPNAIKEYFSEFPMKALHIGIRIVLAALVFFIGIWVIKLIRKIISKSMEKAKVETGVKQFIDSFVKAALYVVLIFLIASSFGVDAASIVAILGSAGVAIGLALQGSLSNLAGGVLILILKPFHVGDYILAGSSGKEGTVKEIQIFYTKLLTPDNQVVILPNGALANGAITNVTKEKTRRIDVLVGISYDSNIQEARNAIMKLLDSDETILKDKEKRVLVSELGSSSVDLIVRFWVKGKDYWDTKFKITEDIKSVLDEAGVVIPFNQLDVHLDKN